MIRCYTFFVCLLFFLVPINSALAQTSGQADAFLALFAEADDEVSVIGTLNANSDSSSSTGAGTVSTFGGGPIDLTTGPIPGPFDLAAGDSFTLSSAVGTGVIPPGVDGTAMGTFIASGQITVENNSGSATSVLFGLQTQLLADVSGFLPDQDTIANTSYSVFNLSNNASSTLPFGGERVFIDDFTEFTIDLDIGESVSFDASTTAFSNSIVVNRSTGDPAVPEPSAALVLCLGSTGLALKRRRKT